MKELGVLPGLSIRKMSAMCQESGGGWVRSASHAFSLGKTKVAMLAAAAFQKSSGGCDAGRAFARREFGKGPGQVMPFYLVGLFRGSCWIRSGCWVCVIDLVKVVVYLRDCFCRAKWTTIRGLEL